MHMDKYSQVQQLLYRDKLFSTAQMKRLVDATREHMSKYVQFDDNDYSMIATIDNGIELVIKIKVKSFVTATNNK